MQDVRTMLEDFFGIVPGNAATDPPIFKRGIASPDTNADAAALDDLLNLVAPDKLETGITANAGGGQSGAYALTALISDITTCTTAGDSVKLPTAAAGKVAVVRNSGATNLNVFPASGDAINALAVNLSVMIPPLCSVTFFAIDGTTWYAEIGKGLYLSAPTTQTGGILFRAVANSANYIISIINEAFGQNTTITLPDPGAAAASIVLTEGAQTINGALSLTALLTLTGLLKMKITSGITAATTQTQAAATVLASNINHVATCANANDGVALPAAAAGLFVLIKNAGANTLKIWPSNGASDKINDGSADAAITLATTKSVLLYAIDATNWYSIALD